MKEINKNQAIILLIVLIAIGGIVLYGKGESPRVMERATEKNYVAK